MPRMWQIGPAIPKDGSNILKQLNEDKITLQKFEELRNLS